MPNRGFFAQLRRGSPFPKASVLQAASSELSQFLTTSSKSIPVNTGGASISQFCLRLRDYANATKTEGRSYIHSHSHGAKRSAPPEVPVEELTIRESDCLPYEYEGPPMATMGGGGGCVVA